MMMWFWTFSVMSSCCLCCLQEIKLCSQIFFNGFLSRACPATVDVVDYPGPNEVVIARKHVSLPVHQWAFPRKRLKTPWPWGSMCRKILHKASVYFRDNDGHTAEMSDNTKDLGSTKHTHMTQVDRELRWAFTDCAAFVIHKESLCATSPSYSLLCDEHDYFSGTLTCILLFLQHIWDC